MPRLKSSRSQEPRLWIFWVERGDGIQTVTGTFFGMFPEKSAARKEHKKLFFDDSVRRKGYTCDPAEYPFLTWPDNIEKPAQVLDTEEDEDWNQLENAGIIKPI